jgi:formate hydrogenlyase subunit 3/multisubunit Na+/H+ antiporter MnhD subunit
VLAERREAMAAGVGGALELALALAALGVVGLPPFAGFWPRLLILDAAVRDGNVLLPATLIAGSLLLVLGLARAGFAPREAVAARARPVRALEVAAFGLLLGVSLAAGLTPRLDMNATPGAAQLPPVAKATEPR